MTHDEIYTAAMIMASGQYLTEHLPDNFMDMKDDDFETFVDNHKWEGVENVPADEVASQISQAADVMIRFHKQMLDRLVSKALDLKPVKHDRRVFVQVINNFKDNKEETYDGES